MDEFKLAIWWPLRLLPDEIDLMLKSELIQTLLEKKSLRCRMYENEKGANILRMTHVEPHKPHLYITHIEKDTVLPGYTATCEIPDVYGWKEIFQSFTQPVVYPVLIKTKDKSLGMLGQNNFVICHFKLVEYDKVDKLGSSYGGINYPYPERWAYPENTSLIYIDGPEKSLAQSLQEEHDKRRNNPFFVDNKHTQTTKATQMEKLYIDFNKIPDGENVVNLPTLKEITSDRKLSSEIVDQFANMDLNDTSEDVADTSPMKLFRILISDNQDHYVHFGISIIVKAENIYNAYMKFWENIINDKNIDFSDGEADPLFENDHFSNWVIDTYDDKYITYERPGKNFKIRVEELDLSKGYALVGDWST